VLSFELTPKMRGFFAKKESLSHCFFLLKRTKMIPVITFLLSRKKGCETNHLI